MHFQQSEKEGERERRQEKDTATCGRVSVWAWPADACRVAGWIRYEKSINK